MVSIMYYKDSYHHVALYTLLPSAIFISTGHNFPVLDRQATGKLDVKHTLADVDWVLS